jgi:hypothetical protein
VPVQERVVVEAFARLSKWKGMKKQTLFVILGLVIGTWGCSFSAGTIATPTPTVVDEVGTVVAATLQAFAAPTNTAEVPVSTESPTPTGIQDGGTSISHKGISFVVPSNVAGGAIMETMTAVESNSDAPWDVAPTHLRFTLTNYQLQGKFHEPRIFVYPAGEYEQMNPNAAEQIDRLRKILTGATPMHETLPIVPFFNATPVLSAQIKIIAFPNGGGGIRLLTQYAQYAAPVNNRELFYHFQGLTSDGKYYIVGILPVTAPILPEDEKPEAAVPEGGFPIPTAVGPNQVYYFSVTEALNTLSPDAFMPSLEALDAIFEFMTMT